MQIMQLIALHLLFAATGFCHVGRAAARIAEAAQGDPKESGEEAIDGSPATEGLTLGNVIQPFKGYCMACTIFNMHHMPPAPISQRSLQCTAYLPNNF